MASSHTGINGKLTTLPAGLVRDVPLTVPQGAPKGSARG
jgi:hypothetical protein